MKKKIIILMLVLISICALSHVSAVDDADFIASENTDTLETQSIDEGDLVESESIDMLESQSIDEVGEDTLNQDNDESLISEGEYRELQRMIDEAEEGAEIELSENYTCDYLITINKSISLVGTNGGGVIKYNGSNDEQIASPFFHVNATGVTLQNLKFIGGTFLYSGAIFWEKDDGSIINCEFRQNSAISSINGTGGALFMLGNNCNLTNCTFIKNTAEMFGGAVIWKGTGGIIRNCDFRENEAHGEGNNSGGGALLLWEADDCLIIDCNFSDNHCINFGGAISILNCINNRIINCNFNRNYVTEKENEQEYRFKGGGAINCGCLNLLVDGCSFINNSANTLPGGAISLSNNTTVKNSYFNGNIADINGDPESALGGTHLIGGYGLEYTIINNTFVLEFQQVPCHAVNIGIQDEEILKENNTFIKTLHNSTVDFIGGLVIEYGASGSIKVKVTGGTIKTISVLNHPEAYIDCKNDVITVSNLVPGTYTLRVSTKPNEDYVTVNGDLSIKVNKAIAVIKAQKLTVAYKKSSYWSITIVDSRDNKPIANMKLKLKVYTGKTYKTVTLTTNSKGIAKYQTKGLTAATHKVIVSGTHVGYTLKSFTSSIKVIKQTPLTFKVKRKYTDKVSSLSITVKNKKTKKPLNKVKVKLLIYTKSKLTKTVILKSKTHQKHKGVVGYATNALTVGKHKVKIMPVDLKYDGSATSYLKITKKNKKYHSITFKVSAKV